MNETDKMLLEAADRAFYVSERKRNESAENEEARVEYFLKGVAAFSSAKQTLSKTISDSCRAIRERA